MNFKIDDSAKGVEKRIFKILDTIITYGNKIDKVFYGNPESKNKILKPGVYHILQELNGIPLCNIVNYLLSRVKVPTNPIFERINEIATKLSNTINDINKFPTISFKSERYSPSGVLQINQIELNEEQRNALAELKTELNDAFTPDLLSTIAQFPQGQKARDTINNLLAYLSGASTLQNLPATKFQNIQKALDDLLSILNAIKLVTLPSIANIPGLGKAIDRLNKIVNPEKLVPFIVQLIRILSGISRSIRIVVKVAQTLRVVAKTLTVIGKILKFIITILKTLPIPAQVVTVGIITIVSDKLIGATKKVDDLIKRAGQIKIATSIIITIMQGLVSKIDLIIIELNKLLITIRGCSLFNETGLESQVTSLIVDLQKSRADISAILPNTDSLSPDITLGRYSIKIIEEQVVDRGIKLRRRRAVAFDERGILILEGTPTFATDISILIEELRIKLAIDDVESIDNIGINDLLTNEDIDEIEQIDDNESANEKLIEDQRESEKDTIAFIGGLPGGRSRLKKIKAMFKKKKEFISPPSSLN